jgi:hypothetical protein
MTISIYDAKYWRAREAEIRILAEGMHDPISKQMMLQVADDYLELAQNAGRPTLQRPSIRY